MSIPTTCVAALALGFCLVSGLNDQPHKTHSEKESSMMLGAFSVSLTVKDLAKSRAFYEALGFEQIHGVPEQNWIILQNGASTIGLFKGMFEGNIMTFNPGWANHGEHPKDFMDVREIQQRLKASGLTLTTQADEDSTGPANFVLSDPDGNTIFFDQHVDAPSKSQGPKEGE